MKGLIRNNFYSIGSSLPIMLVGQLALVIVILLITIYDGGQNVFLQKERADLNKNKLLQTHFVSM